MISLISANWLLFLIALLIGVATAFWAWAASGRDRSMDNFDADDGLLEKAGDAVAPVPEPVVPSAVPAPAPAPVTPKAAAPAAAATTAAAKVAPAPMPAPRPRKRPVVAETPPPPPPGKPNITPAKGDPDNLRLIKGVGPKLNSLLNNLGVTRYDQIAGWKEAEIEEVDKYLESFSGRITRDSWIDQAKYLAKDDIAGFEKKYGKL
ncbi:hypothetical protein [Parasphingorhabdus cellanae]|uniref:Uncharacterized protein n=1 Tax=Parasphingorhabdus cellanae TaxID=2806553 RepID=A0ABX7T9L4_9SPHN|nr:hypothetical protein [Parasphingorhabdus cellanae]QTD56982.1 hypothetical protein J4G78_05280 [Parasphingorhabdus cellanae]